MVVAAAGGETPTKMASSSESFSAILSQSNQGVEGVLVGSVKQSN